ncbi:MAG: VapE domain-containing protein [Methylophilaceae bacterium]
MPKRPPMPFKEIAAAALNSIDRLVPDWIPGGKHESGEYVVRNPTRSDAKAGSFKINMSGTSAGQWADFATNDKGGDLISLYAYIHYLEPYEAAIEVADEIGFKLPDGCRPVDQQDKPKKPPRVDHTKVPKKQTAEPAWVPIYPESIPSDAPAAPIAHSVRGKPEAKWPYKDASGALIGWIYRFKKSDGGKETLPLVYCKNTKTGKYDWRWMQWPAPNRPLYGLDRLAANPEAYVLLVEGEKCADAPLGMIAGAPVSWPGGSKAVDKVDWAPLAGRKIYAWPDCDAQREPLSKAEKEEGVAPHTKPLLAERAQPGTAAMIKIRDKLLDIDPKTEWIWVKIPAPGEKEGGWDVADAIAEGMNAAALTKFITNTRPHLSLVGDAENEKSASTPNPADAQKADLSKNWQDFLLKRKGDIVSCLSNIVDILENDPKWKGVIAYDEFAQRVVKLKKPPYWNNKGEVGEWDATDDVNTAMWLTRRYRFAPSASLVAEAVEAMSHTNVVNPPRDWLDNLVWDGEKRLKSWMVDYLTVKVTGDSESADAPNPRLEEYVTLISYWYLMGIVKRVYEPGAKFDYCLVLEGDQGMKKSSLFEAIGGEWYGDTDLDLNSKDSMSALRGKMVYELSELGALAKSEATKQKSFLARRIDEYRAPYGRREIRAKRTVVFGGTTNEWEWNKDPTGGRRWWPVKVQHQVDTEGFLKVRDQLFAEAVALIKAGKRYWPTEEEQKRLFDPVQLASTIQESYVDALFDHVIGYHTDFTLDFAAYEWLKIDYSKITRDIQTRIGNALRQLGCTKVEKRRNEISRYWYRPPQVDKSQFNQSDKEEFDDDIPF